MRTAHLCTDIRVTPSKIGVRVILALGSVWLALGPVPVRAVPLLTNGGFDVDNTVAGPVSPPTGWTATGDTAADSSHPFSGMNEAFLGTGILSQSIATGAGNTYNLSFELAPGPTVLQDPAATMTVSFAGQTVGTIKGNTLPSTAYQLFTYQVAATSNSSLVKFAAYTTNDAGDWFLDSVIVTANAAPIPEPPSAGLLAAALLGLVAAGPVMRRVKRR